MGQLKTKKKIWVVAAGTGGHIFPGLFLVEELKKINKNIDAVFWGDPQRLEGSLVPKAGYELRSVKAPRWIGQSSLKKIWALFVLFFGFLKLLFTTLNSKVDFAIMVGGYNSIPVGLVCFFRRIPVFLIEPNAQAGLANRLLSKWAKLAFVVPGSNAFQSFKCESVEAFALRPSLEQHSPKNIAKKVLLLGGSQGALTLCKALLSVVEKNTQDFANLDFLIQCGHKNIAKIKKMTLNPNVQIMDFVDDMASLLKQVDFVIARSGASTVRELSYCALPVLYVPYPFAAENHQKKNIAELLNNKAALCVEESEAAFEELLELKLKEYLVGDKAFERRKRMNSKLLQTSKPLNTQMIAAKIFDTLSPEAP